ncbi:hypothetical protein [Nocardia niigatensis]
MEGSALGRVTTPLAESLVLPNGMVLSNRLAKAAMYSWHYAPYLAQQITGGLR